MLFKLYIVLTAYLDIEYSLNDYIAFFLSFK